MSDNPDSKNVNRLLSDRSQSSRDANIIRCLWCFTPLMNLHDFVTEFFNPEHIFRDARTVFFCLTTDHISTCLVMFSARFKTAQFGSVLIRGEWKCSICSDQQRWCGVPARRTGSAERVWKPGTLHGVPWRARVETWQLSWSRMDSAVWIRDWWTSRQLATDAVVCTVSQCLDSWQRMQWYAPSHRLTTAGNGYSGTPWTLDQVKYLFLSVDS